MKRPGLMVAAALALLLAGLALKGWLVQPPRVPAQAAEGQFDTKRAVARLERILGDERPHPVDTDANDAVRERLIAELEAIGLAAEVTEDFACNELPQRRTVTCARIRNVTATIGSAEGEHVMMVAHYDSTPVGPGAADAGIGVAVMLETAHLLRGRPLARPVTLLFNEGEEAGLIGARAFMERNPLAQRVGAIVNLEARGVTGPAIMFETSMPNGPPIGHFARSAQRPVANSLSTDFYKMIPNSTDVAVFEERPYTILNYAIIGNETRYHSPGDDLAALDRRSVEHMGRQALAVVEDMASGREPGLSGRVIYSDLLGLQLVVLPLWAGLVLLGALVLLFAWFVLRAGGFPRVVGLLAATLAGSAALGFIGQLLVRFIREGDYFRAYPWVTTTAVYAGALLVAVAALVLIGRSLDAARLRAGYWLFFLVCGALVALVMPGAIIFFLLPPLVAATGILFGRLLPGAAPAGAILAAFLLYLTLAPQLDLLEMTLGPGAAFLFAPVAAMIAMPFLIELKPLLAPLRPAPLLGGLAAAALAGWVAVALAPAYSPDRMRALGYEYVWDAERNEAHWTLIGDVARIPAAIDALGTFEGGFEVPYSLRRRPAAPAPAEPVPIPTIHHMHQQRSGSGRLMQLRFSAPGAEIVQLRIPAEADARAVRLRGWEAAFPAGGSEDHVFRCHGRSCEDVDLELLLGSREAVEFTLVAMRSGLPEPGRALIGARPALAQPQYAPDMTVAINRARF